MSERCSICGLLSDPCFCYYHTNRLISEIKRRGIKRSQLIKIFNSITIGDKC